jgi:D-aminoacyl-tRNA deacylase
MPIILYTSKNIASKLIAEKLLELNPAIKPIETNAESVLDIPTDYDTDCIIVLSTHKSKNAKPMLTAHFPGNWDQAQMGGKSRTLNIAHGRLLKSIIRELETGNRKRGLNWPLFVEADHHGPTANVPIIFVEIGSTEKEWRNEVAAQIVAEAVNNALSLETGNRTLDLLKQSFNGPLKRQTFQLETVFGIGGGHYSREFTKLALEDEDIAIGHICPKYAIESLAEDTFRQAIEKSVDPVSRVLVLKDGTNAAQKEKAKGLCSKFGLDYAEI